MAGASAPATPLENTSARGTTDASDRASGSPSGAVRASATAHNNDSVFVQFDHSVDGAGNPVWRIDTASATMVILEDCSNCGVKGWGWSDNGYGLKCVRTGRCL
jgi:hypothetical protein